MQSMLFAFRLQNEYELEQLLEAQQDPASPSYHKWLTPEEFGNRFGVSEETYARAVQWLERQGFSNIQTSPNRLSIYFDGYALLVEKAFGVQMDIYEYQGKQYHSNDREAQIPSEYKDVILGLFLDDFPTVAPLYRNGNYASMSPQDMRIAYNLTPVYNRGVTGSGQNIAIVARSDFNLSDVELFQSTFGLATNDPHKVFVGANPGNLGGGEEKEVLLDTEWAGAIAPNAVIQVVISPSMDITQSINYIVDSLSSTHVMSISFGLGESVVSSATLSNVMNLFSQAAAEGQTVLVASGDQGAQQSAGSSLTTGADVNYLCSSSNVICVGGTNLNNNWDSSYNYIAYAGETAWSGSGGGKSSFVSKPSFQYGPGVPTDGWRDVPDVAVLAGSPGAWIIAEGSFSGFGGTSLSAPLWAGLLGLVNQAGSANGVGNANPRIYELGRNQYQSGGSAVFNDITSGSNSTGTVTGFSAGTAYDQVTGWGSFNGDVFISNFFSSSTGTTTRSLTSGVAISDSIAADPYTSPVCGLSQTQYTINVPAGALQLIVSLNSSNASNNIDLYVRSFQAVSQSGANFVADLSSATSLGVENIYVGSQSTPVLATGTYYIGVANCVSSPVSFTLTATVITSLSVPKTEELGIDDGSVETGLLGNGLVTVNRLTPRRYPSTLKDIRVYVGAYQNQPDPVNQQIRLIAFADASGTGRPPASVTRLVDQSVTINGKYGFIDFPISNSPTINQGDWYVGFQYPNPGNGVLAAGDTNGTQAQRSFYSQDGGVTFTSTANLSKQLNFLIRAVVDNITVASPPVINSATAAFQSDGSIRMVISGQDPNGDVSTLTEMRLDGSGQVLGQGSFDVSTILAGMTSFTFYFTITSGNRLSETRQMQIQLGDATSLVSNSVTVSVGLALSVPAGGAAVTLTSGSTGTAKTGAGIVTINSGGTTPPYGTAVFTFNRSGVVVSETGVPASAPTTAARVFIDYETITTQAGTSYSTIGISTGVAIVNTGSTTATVSYVLRDSNGNPITGASGTGTIPVNGHRAVFIDGLASVATGFSFPADFATKYKYGSLDINSTQPLSILALRSTTNQRGDALLTSTPIADLTHQSASSLYFPRLVDGGGWKTSIFLLNTSSANETGYLNIFTGQGTALSVRQQGAPAANSQFPYSIKPGGVWVLTTDGSPTAVNEGSVQLIPTNGTWAPVGAGVFGLTQNGVLVTETGVPSATQTIHARIYVDQSGGHLTGIAIANPQSSSMSVSLTAYQTDGVTPAGTGSASLPLNGNGESAAFTSSLIPNLPAGFTGVLDIFSPSGLPFAALTLRILTNLRGDSVITTFPVADFDSTAPTPIVFPQVVDGNAGGLYRTQFIMLGTTGASTLTLNLYGDDGSLISMISGADSTPAIYFSADEKSSMPHRQGAKRIGN
jgi:hypothetical protein